MHLFIIGVHVLLLADLGHNDETSWRHSSASFWRNEIVIMQYITYIYYANTPPPRSWITMWLTTRRNSLCINWDFMLLFGNQFWFYSIFITMYTTIYYFILPYTTLQSVWPTPNDLIICTLEIFYLWDYDCCYNIKLWSSNQHLPAWWNPCGRANDNCCLGGRWSAAPGFPTPPLPAIRRWSRKSMFSSFSLPATKEHLR